MKRDTVIMLASIFLFFIFLALSFFFDFEAGKEIGKTFYSFLIDMMKILPAAFILIGLFEVWVKRETVEKHLGDESGMRGYFWVTLLAGTIVGGVYVALPLAYSLRNKGAKLSIVFTFIGASGIARVPMTIFEASFLGIKFTVIRLLVSLPLVILSSILLEKYLLKKGYEIKKTM